MSGKIDRHSIDDDNERTEEDVETCGDDSNAFFFDMFAIIGWK